MSTSSETALFTIDIGAPGWCWSQLGANGEGLMAYETSRGRLNLAVPYVVTGRQIAIPLGSFNTLGWRADGADTRLEVSGRTADGLRWVVRATGIAQYDHLSELAYSRRMHPANGVGSRAAEGPGQLIMLTPRVRGFYETGLPCSSMRLTAATPTPAKGMSMVKPHPGFAKERR